VPLEAATAWSALSLLAGGELRRLRICGNCGWLFVDRSRNGSRLWCDMAVCGNRQKASRHYRRRRAAAGGTTNV
jgi:predicted RNA-binding Zn ribbon-like protein